MERTRRQPILFWAVFAFVLMVLSIRVGAPVAGAEPAGEPICESSWSLVSSPNVGSGTNKLFAVSAVSSTDIWAVGYHSNDNGVSYMTLIMHWDGTEWSVVPSPNPSMNNNELYGVEAVAANDVWAVGASEGRPTILHWDGAAWSHVPGAQVNAGYLVGVDALSANDVWAAGFAGSEMLVEHWNGTQWSVVPTPNMPDHNHTLLGISAVSPSDIWAVGHYQATSGDTYLKSLTIHWDGTEWSIVPSPSPGPGTVELNSVAAISADDVWAVGDFQNEALNTLTLVLHWDGEAWAVVPSPNIPESGVHYLFGVAAYSAGAAWAGGFYISGGAFWPLLLHWDGAQWTISDDSVMQRSHIVLRGLTALSESRAWAVGNLLSSTTIVRYNEQQFADVPVGSTFQPYVLCLACKGILGGYPCGGVDEPCNAASEPYFRLNKNITRGQIAKIISEAAGFGESPGGQIYEDVPQGSAFYTWINRLSNRGLVGGYRCGQVPSEPCGGPFDLPYFRPNANATRGQIAKIVSNARGYSDPAAGQLFEDVPPGSGFYEWVQRLASRGIMGGYPCGGPGEPCGNGNLPYFRPGNNATRGQVAKIVANAFFPGCQTSITK